MFDKQIEIPWHRSCTGKDFSKWDWPKDGQVCLIFFYFTAFSISEYIETIDDIDYYGDGKKYTNHIFHDRDGFLTDEDLLWIPIGELPAVSSFKHIIIPDSYLKDPKFARDKPQDKFNEQQQTDTSL
jgi:hypothetical protein